MSGKTVRGMVMSSGESPARGIGQQASHRIPVATRRPGYLLLMAALMLLVAACGASSSSPVPASPSSAAASSGLRSSPPPTAPAAPVPKAAVAFSFARPSVASGDSPRLQYTSRNLPSGAGLYLELKYGTPSQWTSVKHLAVRASGTVTLNALPVGVYDFRLSALRGIDVVANSPEQVLSVVSPPSSSCTACGAVAGGAAGAVVAWLLSLLPWP